MQVVLSIAQSLGTPAIALVLGLLGWLYLKDVKDSIKEVKTELRGEITQLRTSVDDLKIILIQKNISQK